MAVLVKRMGGGKPRILITDEQTTGGATPPVIARVAISYVGFSYVGKRLDLSALVSVANIPNGQEDDWLIIGYRWELDAGIIGGTITGSTAIVGDGKDETVSIDNIGEADMFGIVLRVRFANDIEMYARAMCNRIDEAGNNGHTKTQIITGKASAVWQYGRAILFADGGTQNEQNHAGALEIDTLKADINPADEDGFEYDFEAGGSQLHVFAEETNEHDVLVTRTVEDVPVLDGIIYSSVKVIFN